MQRGQKPDYRGGKGVDWDVESGETGTGNWDRDKLSKKGGAGSQGWVGRLVLAE